MQKDDQIDHQEKLIEELENELDISSEQDLNQEQLIRIADMVNEYKCSIKSHLNVQQAKRSSWADRLADRIASFGGSWSFIVFFSLFLILWMLWNTYLLAFSFDEPPFILLNLILSTLAAFQAPVILMSQNRQAARDKQEGMLSFAINYKAEQENLEIKHLLKKIEDRLERIENRGNKP